MDPLEEQQVPLIAGSTPAMALLSYGITILMVTLKLLQLMLAIVFDILVLKFVCVVLKRGLGRWGTCCSSEVQLPAPTCGSQHLSSATRDSEILFLALRALGMHKVQAKHTQ